MELRPRVCEYGVENKISELCESSVNPQCSMTYDQIAQTACLTTEAP